MSVMNDIAFQVGRLSYHLDLWTESRTHLVGIVGYESDNCLVPIILQAVSQMK